ncbi:MAG: hypothetical protein KGO98_03470 [Rickettsiales bacterium]|nr:hypothetical protein [Rickettsiales bacterium]
MAEKSDGNPKDTALGEREQFDSFDRLQKVDQKDLNVDKLKATDKDSDSEELLATKDRTHYTNIKEESGIVKFTNTDLQLDDNRKIEDVDLASIENFTKTGASLNKNMLSKSGNLLTDNDFKKTTGTQSIEQNSNTITGEARISSIADREEDINPLQPLKTNNADIQKDPSPEKDLEGSQDKQNDDSDPKPLVSQQPGDKTGGGGDGGGTGGDGGGTGGDGGGTGGGGGGTGGGGGGTGGGGGGTGGGGGNNGDDHDNGHGNDDDGNDDSNPGNDDSNPGNGGGGTGGGGGGNNGDDHDNGHGNDDDHNDDSNPGNGGGGTGGGHDNPPTPPVLLSNGNYSLTPGQGFSLTIDSIDSDAGYNSSFGHYFADNNGNPISGSIDFTNVKESLGIGDSVTINYAPGDIPPGAVTVGFFIIPNGDALNPLLPEGANVTFSLNDQGQWAANYNGTPINGEGAPVYFSDPNLNPDGGISHSNNNAGQISFEDLFGGSSDGDYNDVVVNVQLTPYTGSGLDNGGNHGGGVNGDDHDNGHGNDDDHNDDSNPGNGRGTGTGDDDGDAHGNNDSNSGNSGNTKDTRSEEENNNSTFNNQDNQVGNNDANNSQDTVDTQSQQLDTNISSMDRGSWTDIVSKDSEISSQPITSNWVEQVDSNHEADIVDNNDKDKGQENNNSEDSSHETTDDTINNDDKYSSNHNY